MEQPFVFIFTLILMAAILVFGVKTFTDLDRQKDTVEVARFIDSLQDAVTRYYNFDIGSNKRLELPAPSGVEEVCFLDRSISKTQTSRDDVEDAFLAAPQSNTFLFPAVFAKNDFTVEHLTVNPLRNPLCFSVKGTLRATLETKAAGTSVVVEIRP